ncbi:hypothetical protein FSP39_014126 [Pinctada imbricata]|uniref:Fibronectin type-III domain-containing protein n=1 Tax=Pinctada imbricata TaxID=66713 RepID=A0AA88Y9B2_PINIB|nr:hypothetical protein FSP39_014126 [Pinctada imbricata]
MERIEDGPMMEKDKAPEGNLDANCNQNANTERLLCSEVQENGHVSPTQNGLECSENGQNDVGAAAASTSPVLTSPPPPSSPQPLQPDTVSSTSNHHNNHYQHSNSNHQHNHQGHSPNRYSPSDSGSPPSSTQHVPQLSPRGCSPQNGGSLPNSQSPPNQQHVVHVHVQPGETFSVRVGDQIQHIQGPATVRMVSNNGPPLPMPMQVPPGHMVQQIVDEHGILTHVILSPQIPGMPVGGQPMTGGPNNSAPQYYPSYGPHYPTHPYPSSHHHAHHGASPHVHTGAPTHPHGTPPPANCNSHPSGPVHPGPSQPNSMEGRASRQREKMRRKLQEKDYYPNRQPPRHANGKQKGMNGDVPPNDTGQAELEEERKILQTQLSNMPEPVVSVGHYRLNYKTVSEVEARSALIQLAQPDYDQNEFDIDPQDFRYTLLLSDKGKEGKYKLVYTGDATEITLKDLKPATDYHLRVYTSLDDLKGNTTDAVKFTTTSCEPDPPPPPKLSSKTKTSITLKWNTACENGSKVSTYALECDKGTGAGFEEVYNGNNRQHRIAKLNASTKYTFRLAAINSNGKSQYSQAASFYTSGSVPSQPDPPMLSEAFINALTISWIKRPNEDSFLLQMEDDLTRLFFPQGHGFIPIYNGSNLSYKVKSLRRNTEYKFRLAAINDEGQSKMSDIVQYRTKPDRPCPPPKPQIKGKIHANSFRVVWEPPKDDGGSEINKYIVELDDSRGYETLYEGTEREHVCDHLVPGKMYLVRVACCNAGGRSEFSEPCGATTQAVIPGQCHAPKLQGKPKATSLHLRWGYPDYDGGAPVSEFAAQMITPDNTSREVYKGHDLDCIVAGLSPGRPYLFQVRAFNRVGGGPWSDPLEVVSGAGVPDPPKSPVVTCRSPQSAIVCWEAPVNNGATITDYKLEWQHKSDVTDFSQLYYGPQLSHEVKGLTPATLYSFRVQAINSAGAGPYSSVGTCVTPPSSPASIVSIRHSSTATTITLTWKEPNCNGSDIIAYNLDLGDKQFNISAVTEYTIEDLQPETVYKVRIQAVNGIGVGPYSSPVRVTTRPLPPNPPRLECMAVSPNSLKLKWGDNKNLDMVTYTLEMEREDENYQVIYQGSAHTFKVNKLAELTNYDFRLYASNAAGDGPYSDMYTFTTTMAPPPALKAPKVSEVSFHSCYVDWQSCRPMGSDSIEYVLQLQSREHEYTEVYRGRDTSHQIRTLQPKSEYQVRVCAIRICENGSQIVGAFSPSCSFSSQSSQPLTSAVETKSSSDTEVAEPKQLTDQQWAMIILFGFVLLAVLIAFVAQQILAYTSSHSARHDSKL